MGESYEAHSSNESSKEEKEALSSNTKRELKDLFKDVIDAYKREDYDFMLSTILDYLTGDENASSGAKAAGKAENMRNNLETGNYYRAGSYLEFIKSKGSSPAPYKDGERPAPEDREEKKLDEVYGLETQVLYDKSYIEKVQNSNGKIPLMVNFHGATSKANPDEFFRYNKSFDDPFHGIAFYPYNVIQRLKTAQDVIGYIEAAKEQAAKMFSIDPLRFDVICPLHSRSGITFFVNQVVNDPEVRSFVKENHIPIINIDPVPATVDQYIDIINDGIPLGMIGGLIKNRSAIQNLLEDPRLPASGTYFFRRKDGSTYTGNSLTMKADPTDTVYGYELKGRVYIEMLNKEDGFDHQNAKKAAAFMMDKFA